jgi:hypothetical protein
MITGAAMTRPPVSSILAVAEDLQLPARVEPAVGEEVVTQQAQSQHVIGDVAEVLDQGDGLIVDEPLVGVQEEYPVAAGADQRLIAGGREIAVERHLAECVG